jgi:hypothetical protein
MNKTQKRKQINSRFYTYVEDNFPQYTLDFDNGYGRVYLVHTQHTCSSDTSIEYHQSYHDLVCFNHAPETTKQDVSTMQTYINNNIIPLVDTVINF